MSKRSDEITELRKVRIAACICRDCGDSPLMNGKVVCVECSVKRSTYGKNFKASQIAKGLCVKCGLENNIKRNGKFLCQRCSEKSIESFRQRRKRNKEFIIAFFGGKCVHCGEADICCLGLDHIDNDGKLDKVSAKGNRVITPTWYAKLYKSINENKLLPRRLQLLCHNCHAKKDSRPWWL